MSEQTQACIAIKALPGASKTGLAGMQEGRIRVKVAAAPEDGKANAELIRFFAALLGCAKKEVSIQSGEKSRLKTLSIPADKLACLQHLLAGV
jgi:uncharacterized protein (TIGR00251 family)